MFRNRASKWARLPKFGDSVGARAVHEESGDIIGAALDAAAARGLNVVHPIIRGHPESVRDLVDGLRAHGYKVHVALVDLPSSETGKRVVARFEDGKGGLSGSSILNML